MSEYQQQQRRRHETRIADPCLGPLITSRARATPAGQTFVRVEGSDITPSTSGMSVPPVKETVVEFGSLSVPPGNFLRGFQSENVGWLAVTAFRDRPLLSNIQLLSMVDPDSPYQRQHQYRLWPWIFNHGKSCSICHTAGDLGIGRHIHNSHQLLGYTGGHSFQRHHWGTLGEIFRKKKLWQL